ncbi:MAG: histidinol-phosphatase HisJ family protein [Clostridiales bacterium]|jgi:histidinol-phosphatase (PHP family)|nr:histidinol-phosphatase HisJ family protein [Clostridiales bacterium]
MVISDMHTHTRYSSDSKALMEDYCKKALVCGVNIICFTDHADYNEKDSGYMYYDADAFFREFNEIKEKYRGRIELLSGIEFSEPHLYGEKLEQLSKFPYDFILGSIHFFYNDMFPSEMLKNGLPAELIFEHYWEELLKMVDYGCFDCVAHLDFPKRYYNKLIYSEEKLSQILDIIIKKEICLEINTSSLRKRIGSAMPDRDMLSLYKALGGKYVTIGSDAHSAGELAADFAYARELAESLKLDAVIFRQRSLTHF